jgi:hypothetical protein
LLLVDLLYDLDDVIPKTEGADARAVVPHRVALLEGLGVLQLAELGDVGLVVAEGSEVLEEVLGGLHLELKEDGREAVLSLGLFRLGRKDVLEGDDAEVFVLLRTHVESP